MGPPTVPEIYGPLLVGVFLNMILFGVVLSQALTYYRTYKRDQTWIRYFILYLFMLELVNTGFNVGMMYEPLILKFGLSEALVYTPKMLTLDPIVTALISTSCQFFIAWRIKVISGSILIPLGIGFLGLLSLGGATTLTVWVAIKPEFAHLREYQVAIILWLVSAAASDLLITLTLVWSLTRRKTGMKETDDKISKIIRLTVHTGLLTSVLALSDAIVFLVVPNTTLNFIWDFPLAKVYAISLISTLNARVTSAGLNVNANTATSSSANDNNVLFGRLISQWKAHSRSEPSTKVSTARRDVLELHDTDTTQSQLRKPIDLENLPQSGVAVHTVVHTIHEQSHDSESEVDWKKRSDSL